VLTSVPTTTPYPELLLQWNPYASAIGYGVVARQGCGGAGATCVSWTIGVSATAAGATPSFQMPDLTALTGWDSRLQFVTGTAVDGAIAGQTSTAGSGDFVGPSIPAAGTTRTSAAFGFTITP
jgi:hypothetical protein